MSATPQSIELACPAKINLSLSILGRRVDGFHDLLSVVSQVDFSDTLRLKWNPEGRPAEDRIRYVQDAEGLEQIGESIISRGEDTVSRAVRIFRDAAGLEDGSIEVEVLKRIPIGAGLGGGSSNGVSALKAMQLVLGERAANVDMSSMSASIGSDCPLFLSDGPVLMEGRGERISLLETSLTERFLGQQVLLFKPPYSINTAEAYGRLASRHCYSAAMSSQDLLHQWKSSGEKLPPAGNDFERLCSFWMPDLVVVLTRLRTIHGLEARLSGSGSACYLITKNPETAGRILEGEMHRAWGGFQWMEGAVLK